MIQEIKLDIQQNVVENLNCLIKDLTNDIIYLEARSNVLNHKRISATVNENFNERRRQYNKELYKFFSDYLYFLLKNKKIDPRVFPSLQYLKDSFTRKDTEYVQDQCYEEEDQLNALLIDMIRKRNISIEMLDFIKSHEMDSINDESFHKLFESVIPLLNNLSIQPKLPTKENIAVNKNRVDKKVTSAKVDKSKKSRINKMEEKMIHYLNNEDETHLLDLDCCSTSASFSSVSFDQQIKEQILGNETNATLGIDIFLKRMMGYLVKAETDTLQSKPTNEIQKETSMRTTHKIHNPQKNPPKPVRVVHFKDEDFNSSSSSSSSFGTTVSSSRFSKRCPIKKNNENSDISSDPERRKKDQINKNKNMETEDKGTNNSKHSNKINISKNVNNMNSQTQSPNLKTEGSHLSNQPKQMILKERIPFKKEGMVMEEKNKLGWLISKKYSGIDKHGNKCKLSLSSTSSLMKRMTNNPLNAKPNNLRTNSGAVLHKIENSVFKGKNVKCFLSLQKGLIKKTLENDSFSNKSKTADSKSSFLSNKQGIHFNNDSNNRSERLNKESKKPKDSSGNPDSSNSDFSDSTESTSKKSDSIRRKKHLIKIKKDGNGEYIVKREGGNSRKCVYEFEIIFVDSDDESSRDRGIMKNRKKEIAQFSFLGNGSKIENMKNIYLSHDEKIREFPFYNRNRLGYMNNTSRIRNKDDELTVLNIKEQHSELKKEITTIINDIKNYRINKLIEDRYNSDFVHTNKLRSIYLQLLDRQRDLEKERNFYKSELEMIHQKGDRAISKVLNSKEHAGSSPMEMKLQDSKEKEKWKKELELQAKEQHLKEKEEALNKKEKELSEKEKNFKDSQDQSNSKTSEFSAKIDEQDKKLQELQQQNKQKEKEVKELSDHNLQLDKKIIELQCELKHSKEMLTREKLVNQELNDKFELNLKKEEQVENRKIEKKIEEIKLLQEECTSWKKKFENETKEKEKIKEEVKNQVKEIKELKDQIEKLVSDNTLELFRKSVLQQVNNTDHEIKYLRDLLELFTKELENKLTREKALNEMISKLQNECLKNKKKLYFSKKKLTNSKVEIKDMKNEIDFLNTKIENLLEAMTFLKSKVAELESQSKKPSIQKNERTENQVQKEIKQMENIIKEVKPIENKIREIENKTREKKNCGQWIEKEKQMNDKQDIQHKSKTPKGYTMLPSIDMINKNIKKENKIDKTDFLSSKNHINIQMNVGKSNKKNKKYEVLLSNTSISEADSSLLSNAETNEENSIPEVMRTTRHPINMLELPNVSTS